MIQIYDNLFPTARLLTLLEPDRHFNIEDLNDLGASIPVFVWCLWVRAQSQSGQVEVIKGPHYQHSFVTIGDLLNWKERIISYF